MRNGRRRLRPILRPDRRGFVLAAASKHRAAASFAAVIIHLSPRIAVYYSCTSLSLQPSLSSPDGIEAEQRREGRGGGRRVMNDAIMYNLELSSLFTASSLRAAGRGPAGARGTAEVNLLMRGHGDGKGRAMG